MIFEKTQSACLRAMGMLASGRAWLVFLISLALLLEIGLFAAANWADVLQVRGPGAAAAPPADQAQSCDVRQQPTAAAPAEPSAASQPALNMFQKVWTPAGWERVMKIALPIAGFVGLASAFILIVLSIVGIQVNLVGRLPALAAMISALYWSILTVVLLFPWGSLILASPGQTARPLPWIFYGYDDIAGAVAASVGASRLPGLVWLRFLVWPVIGLLAAWVAGARFGNAYWQAVGLGQMPGRGEQAKDV